MAEKEITGRVDLSSSLTGFIKYVPVLIGVPGVVIILVSGDREIAIIPIMFLLIGFVINFFIAAVSVDKNYIYIKHWVKENKYPIESLQKVGDFTLAKGWTIIDIKTNASTTRTFLIIGDFGNPFFPDYSKDVSEFLIKLKSAKTTKTKDLL